MQIAGLSSPAGKRLNGSGGAVIRQDLNSGHIGFDIAGATIKAIKPGNLQSFCRWTIVSNWWLDYFKLIGGWIILYRRTLVGFR